MVAEKMTSNKDTASASKSVQEIEDDFMWFWLRLSQCKYNYKAKYIYDIIALLLVPDVAKNKYLGLSSNMIVVSICNYETCIIY